MNSSKVADNSIFHIYPSFATIPTADYELELFAYCKLVCVQINSNSVNQEYV